MYRQLYKKMIYWTEPELKNSKTWIVKRNQDG